MNILRARNHKGVQLIAVGENATECVNALMHSAARSQAETIEVCELAALGALLPLVDRDEPGVLAGSDFWDIRWR